jgi:hypothetical protein
MSAHPNDDKVLDDLSTQLVNDVLHQEEEDEFVKSLISQQQRLTPPPSKKEDEGGSNEDVRGSTPPSLNEKSDSQPAEQKTEEGGIKAFSKNLF